MIVEKRRYYSKRHPILVDPFSIKSKLPRPQDRGNFYRPGMDFCPMELIGYLLCRVGLMLLTRVSVANISTVH